VAAGQFTREGKRGGAAVDHQGLAIADEISSDSSYALFCGFMRNNSLVQG